MDLKDKLNLLWKYLLLVVIVFGLAMHLRGPHHSRGHHSAGKYSAGRGYMGGPHMGMGHGSMIKVEKQITNGDTTVAVWVDGEQIDNPKEFLEQHKGGFKSKGGHTMHGEKGRGEKEIHIEMRMGAD